VSICLCNGCFGGELSCLEACLGTLPFVAAVIPADAYQHFSSIAKKNTANNTNSAPLIPDEGSERKEN
jgi:hypothetical protein